MKSIKSKSFPYKPVIFSVNSIVIKGMLTFLTIPLTGLWPFSRSIWINMSFKRVCWWRNDNSDKRYVISCGRWSRCVIVSYCGWLCIAVNEEPRLNPVFHPSTFQNLFDEYFKLQGIGKMCFLKTAPKMGWYKQWFRNTSRKFKLTIILLLRGIQLNHLTVLLR